MSEKPETLEMQPENSPVAMSETVENSKEKIEQVPSLNEDNIVIPRTSINYVVIAVVFFAVGMLMGSLTFGSSIDSDVIEDAVTSVLIEAGLMQEPADMDILVDDDPYLGAEDAPIVIVEFSAYACPYCGRHYNETHTLLLENYGEYIRYVYRDFPATNPNISFPAALAANCANDQGLYWEFHDMLFTNQETLIQSGQAYLNQVASDLDMDIEQFSECLTQQTYLQEVNDDFDAGVAFGVTGTPSFFINGQAHSGARPYSYFEGIVLRELEKAGIDINS